MLIQSNPANSAPSASDKPPFAVGDRVSEHGGGITGVTIKRGEYPGEWRLSRGAAGLHASQKIS